MYFRDLHVNHRLRYSLGREMEAGVFHISIPVNNRLADYEEYYALTTEEFDSFMLDRCLAASLWKNVDIDLKMSGLSLILDETEVLQVRVI